MTTAGNKNMTKKNIFISGHNEDKSLIKAVCGSTNKMISVQNLHNKKTVCQTEKIVVCQTEKSFSVVVPFFPDMTDVYPGN